jgi:nitrogen fixation protein FixH
MCCCGVLILPHDMTQPSMNPARPPRPITGRFVRFCFIGFFGVIAAVNATMMTLAIRTMPGLDVANGYVASQGMNREIDAMRSQTERAWTADVAAALKNNVAPISISLSDRLGKPVTGLAVTARLAHPALTRADHTGALIERRPGVYSADLANIQAGAWTLVVEASQSGERVFASRNRIVLVDAKPAEAAP